MVEQVFYDGHMSLTDTRAPVDAALQVGMQGSLFGSADLGFRPFSNDRVDLDERSQVHFEPGWVEGSDAVFEILRDEMPWRSVERPMYDRVVEVPRLICTVDVSTLDPDHALVRITDALQRMLDREFSSVGLNYYRHGQDSVAWHRDRFGATGRPTTVALVSLGSPRTLAMRPHPEHPAKTAETTRTTPATTHRWRLGHGDLLVMTGACQHRWEHCVPKERAVGPRISLAFRCRDAAGGPRIAGVGVPPLWASHNLQ